MKILKSIFKKKEICLINSTKEKCRNYNYIYYNTCKNCSNYRCYNKALILRNLLYNLSIITLLALIITCNIVGVINRIKEKERQIELLPREKRLEVYISKKAQKVKPNRFYAINGNIQVLTNSVMNITQNETILYIREGVSSKNRSIYITNWVLYNQITKKLSILEPMYLQNGNIGFIEIFPESNIASSGMIFDKYNQNGYDIYLCYHIETYLNEIVNNPIKYYNYYNKDIGKKIFIKRIDTTKSRIDNVVYKPIETYKILNPLREVR